MNSRQLPYSDSIETFILLLFSTDLKVLLYAFLCYFNYFALKALAVKLGKVRKTLSSFSIYILVGFHTIMKQIGF